MHCYVWLIWCVKDVTYHISKMWQCHDSIPYSIIVFQTNPINNDNNSSDDVISKLMKLFVVYISICMPDPFLNIIHWKLWECFILDVLIYFHLHSTQSKVWLSNNSIYSYWLVINEDLVNASSISLKLPRSLFCLSFIDRLSLVLYIEHILSWLSFTRIKKP